MKTTFSKIKSLTKVKNDKSYDFAVEDTHRIIAKHKDSSNAYYTSNCWHPDVEEFITAKQTEGRLTKFNMSVLLSDDFMTAVKNDDKWDLIFPDYEKNSTLYDKEWDGNIDKWKEKGYPIKVVKSLKARELYDLIMTSTYNRNEPGVLFVDTINKKNNLYYEEYISATNPCAEQALPIGGVCNLGSLNLTQFINKNSDGWDYDSMGKTISYAVRMMDNVNSRTNVPLPEQAWNLENKRRIGLGIFGYGSALMMMKLRYGSKKALELTEELMKFIMNTAYKASALLAKEKGAFPLFDKEKHLIGEFVKNLDQDVKDLIAEYGIRNSHLLSIQPTGNTSIMANVISGGLEPIFMPIYKRTSLMPYAPEGIDIPKKISWSNKTYESENEWGWIKEGDEDLMIYEHTDGYTYKFDKSRGLLRETVVKDYAVRYLEERGEWDTEAEWNATTTELNVDEHVNTMTIMAKYIDSALSKTLNLPNDYSYEDFKNLYMDLYDTGTVKGATTYRDGTMTQVLGSAEKKTETSRPTEKERPEHLKCDIHHMTIKKEPWVALVGLLEDGDPYELFCFRVKNIHLPKNKPAVITKVKGTKTKKATYNLEVDGLIIEDLSQHFESTEEESLMRLISMNLRRGHATVAQIVEQISKVKVGFIGDFNTSIVRTLKKYIDYSKEDTKEKCLNCGSTNVVLSEGCSKCQDCGSSKCG